MNDGNTLFSELQKMAGSALGALGAAGTNVKGEIEALVRRQVDTLMSKANVVPREEFEMVRDMAQKARVEQEALNRRVAELEARLAPPTET